MRHILGQCPSFRIRRHSTVNCMKITTAISRKIRAGNPSGPVALLTSTERRNFSVHRSRKNILSSNSPSAGNHVGSARVAMGSEFFISHVVAKRFALWTGSNSQSPSSVRIGGMLDDFGCLFKRMAFIFHHFLLPRVQACNCIRVLSIYLLYSPMSMEEYSSRFVI